MCTQCTLYSSSVFFLVLFFYVSSSYKGMYFGQTFSTGITNKRSTKVEIQEQTASLSISYFSVAKIFFVMMFMLVHMLGQC